MKRIIPFAVLLLLAGCDKSKQEVDDATSQCLALGGEPVYSFSKSEPRTIYRIRCNVKAPNGEVYQVQPNGRGLNQ